MTALSESTDRAPTWASSRRLAEIPVRSQAAPACEASGLFALQVLGEAMAPEFEHGDIIVAEADGALADGAFVVARSGEEWVLRQLKQRETGWSLVALNPAWPEVQIADLAPVRGVVVQKSRPGRRRSLKRYV